jgi:dihydrodipicolinate synthase/N-acetylneuraminate lyase
MVQFGEHLSKVEDGFTVLAGSAATYYSALALGAHGAVLAIAGVAPKMCVDIFNAVREAHYQEARQLHRKLAPLAKLVGAQYGVPGLKAALDLCGYTGGASSAAGQPTSGLSINSDRFGVSGTAGANPSCSRASRS